MRDKLIPFFGAVLVLFVSMTNASAALVNLPAEPVGVTHGVWLGGTLGGTMDITLSGIPAGYDVANGAYAGWCAEDNHLSDPPAGAHRLYDSTNAAGSLPATYQTVPWNKVNYLLNNKIGSIGEVQYALWHMIGTNSTNLSNEPANVIAMVSAANSNGANFVPGLGQTAAVLIFTDGYGAYGANPDQWQDTLIEVRAAVPIPAAAWLLGTGLVGLVALRRRKKQPRIGALPRWFKMERLLQK